MSVEFSAFNKKILFSYAHELEQKIANLAPQGREVSMMSPLASWFPSAKSVGQAAGYAVATTHGAGFSNHAIEFVCKRIFNADTVTRSGWFKSIIFGAVRPPMAEMAKLALTPKVVPVLQFIGISLGGLTAAGAVALFSILYGRILSSGNQFTLHNPPPIDQLLKLNESGKICDAHGNELSESDLADIRTVVMTYNTLTKFIAEDRSTLDQLLAKFMLLRSDNNTLYYQDGKKVSPAELALVEKAYKRLKGLNPMEKAKAIHKMIKLLAEHDAKVSRETLLDKKYLVCEDGIVCERDGIVVDPHAYAAEQRSLQTDFDKFMLDAEIIGK